MSLDRFDVKVINKGDREKLRKLLGVKRLTQKTIFKVFLEDEELKLKVGEENIKKSKEILISIFGTPEENEIEEMKEKINVKKKTRKRKVEEEVVEEVEEKPKKRGRKKKNGNEEKKEIKNEILVEVKGDTLRYSIKGTGDVKMIGKHYVDKVVDVVYGYFKYIKGENVSLMFGKNVYKITGNPKEVEEMFRKVLENMKKEYHSSFQNIIKIS